MRKKKNSSPTYSSLKVRASSSEKERRMTEGESISVSSSLLSSPDAFREHFNTTKRLAAIVLYPCECTGSILKALRGTLFVQRGVRNVVNIRLPKTSLEGQSAANTAREGHNTPAATQNPSENTIAIEKEEEEKEAKLFLMDPAVLAASQVQSPDELSFSSTSFRKLLRALPLSQEDAAEWLKLPQSLVERLNSAAAECRKGPRLYVGTTTYDVALSYKNYTMSEILNAIFAATPAMEGGAADLVALSGFEQVGHIAHVNLSKAHARYKSVIGQVILECNPTVTVVVNKLDMISSVYREFAMEVIAARGAGAVSLQSHTTDPNQSVEALNALLTATVRQHGCVFRVPYNRVYWNSRLSHEHTRLVNGVRAGDVFFDVMAGVGPFAIPAAQRGAIVYANDLNPVAAEYMELNARLNHVKELNSSAAAGIRVYNMDGRAFLNDVVYRSVMVKSESVDSVKPRSKPGGSARQHVVMNLPALAVEFLDVFSPASVESPWRQRPEGCTADSIDKNLILHVYCFSSAEDVLGDAVRQVEHHLGFVLQEANKESVHMVRDVAPTKRMVCVSFTLPTSFWESQTTAPSGLQGIAEKGGCVVEQEAENLLKIRKLEP